MESQRRPQYQGVFRTLQVLRFVVEALLHVVGLRPEPPNPIRVVLSKKDQTPLERFKKTHDDEFSAMADSQKLEPWLITRFENLLLARQQRIKQWDEDQKAKKDHAHQEIKRLSALLIITSAPPQPQVTSNRHIPNPPAPSLSFGSP